MHQKMARSLMIEYQYTNCEILFVGINPHPGSLRRQVPFSNNKLFWYLLSDAGLIAESRTELRDDAALLDMWQEKFNRAYRLGFINIINRATPDITGLRIDEELPGRKRITKIIQTEQPKVVCFVGKVTYARYTGEKQFDWGWQAPVKQSHVFVMHAPLRGPASVRVNELQQIQQVL